MSLRTDYLDPLAGFMQKQGTAPCLTRWLILLPCLHLVVSGFLAVAGLCQDLFIIQDSLEYLQLASYPLTDGIYSLDGIQPSAKREPGYSGYIMAFMAAGIARPHHYTVLSLWPIVASQIILYGWVSAAIARHARSLFGGAAAWLSLIIMQASPIAIYQHSIGSECLATVLLGLVFLEISRHWRTGPSWPVVPRTALWMSFLCITKSVNVLFVPVIGILLWLRTPARWHQAVLFILLSLTPAMMWTARNKTVFGLPIMGSIDGFSSLYRANILPYYQISSPDHPAMPEEAQKAIAACKNDAEKYLWYKSAALAWLKENPWQYVKQCIHRTAAMFIELYRQETIAWWRYPIVLLIGNDQLILTFLLIACLLPLLRRQDIWVETSLLFFLFSTAIYAAVYGIERYLHPSFYLLAPVHGACIMTLIFRKTLPAAPPPAAAPPPTQAPAAAP